MSHRAISIIECSHVSPEGERCRVHLLVDTSSYDKDPVKARVARRMLTDEKSPWQVGIVGHVQGLAMQTLDFCPEHHVTTQEMYPGSKPWYDLDLIPDQKRAT